MVDWLDFLILISYLPDPLSMWLSIQLDSQASLRDNGSGPQGSEQGKCQGHFKLRTRSSTISFLSQFVNANPGSEGRKGNMDTNFCWEKWKRAVHKGQISKLCFSICLSVDTEFIFRFCCYREHHYEHSRVCLLVHVSKVVPCM